MGYVDKMKKESVFKKERRITDEEKNSGGLVGSDDGHGTGDSGVRGTNCQNL